MSQAGKWVAGVYIREAAISCVVGQVVQPSAGRNVFQIGKGHAPRTQHRDRLIIDDIDCVDQSPSASVYDCARILRDRSISEGINISAVHVACFGSFSNTVTPGAIEFDDQDIHDQIYNDIEDTSIDLSRTNLDGFEDHYGEITNVSMYLPGWEGVNLYKIFREVFFEIGLRPKISVGTDVDAAAFGEFLYDSRHVEDRSKARYAKETTLVCINFSRTVNCGIIYKGEPWDNGAHSLLSIIHPPRFTIKNSDGESWVDLYEGNGSYHKDCLESLISLSAIEDRAKMSIEDIPRRHRVWNIAAHYIAQSCITITGILSPNSIVLTGRVIRQLDDHEFASYLVQKVREYFYYGLRDLEGGIRPNYPALMDVEEFIRLPRRPKREKKEYPDAGLPGRHGALRIAASKA